jgi:quercetin dioxygenase-like cupin family protein
MKSMVRRVITGHDDAGRSVIARDENLDPSRVVRDDGRPVAELWATVDQPVHPDPGRSGFSQFRVVDVPPGVKSAMHVTDTVDYAIMLEGELHLILDTEETLLVAGDTVVQLGTMHAWHNRSNRPARMVFVNLGGQVTDREFMPDSPV